MLALEGSIKLLNIWAEPEGYVNTVDTSPVMYQIKVPEMSTATVKDGKLVVELSVMAARHKTSIMWNSGPNHKSYFHELAVEDQWFANAITDLVQQACSYFYLPDEQYIPMEGVPEIVVSDEAIAERIRRIDLGENFREADRSKKERYPLTELPFDQQRALVEQIEDLKRVVGFAIIGPITVAAAAVYTAVPESVGDTVAVAWG